MKKTAILVAAMTALALGASAEVVDLFDMSETAGTGLSGLSSSGTLGTSWKNDDLVGATDGSGAFVLSGGLVADTSVAVFDKNNPPEGMGLTYTLSMNLAGWDMTTAATNDSVELIIKSNASTPTPAVYIEKISTTETRLRLVCGDQTRSVTNGLTGGATALDVYWNATTGVGGGNIGATAYDWTGVTFADFTGDPLKKMALQADSDNVNWGGIGTTVSIDSIGLSVIPEPATIGMVSFVGLATFFIRRRLMM